MMKMFSKRKKLSAGFTMIELLVAMSVLLIIVLVCTQIFQQAKVAWASGQDVVDMDMTGRAVVDCIAQELKMAVDKSTAISTNSISFKRLGAAQAGSPALQQVVFNFDGSYVTRNGVNICPGFSVSYPRPGVGSLAFSPITNSLPDYVDIVALVAGASSTNQYQARVYFPNRNRYEL